MKKKSGRFVVLISGRGSNLKALIDAARGQQFQIVAVIADREAEGGLYAKNAGIPFEVYKRADFLDKSAHRAALFKAVDSYEPDFVLLAGLMIIIPAEITERFDGRLVNIHPSLLPLLPGLHTHQRALDEKLTEHGCTVHFVDSGLDTGPRIAQGRCPINNDDTAETLAARVLTLEHKLYPWVAEQLARGGIQKRGNVVEFDEQVRQSAALNSFVIPE
jgi:phosphoribosylglycinamide formyltransferase-1